MSYWMLDEDELVKECEEKDKQIENFEENYIRLTCPICGGSITDDVIDHLICDKCRRTFTLELRK